MINFLLIWFGLSIIASIIFVRIATLNKMSDDINVRLESDTEETKEQQEGEIPSN